MDQDLKDLIKGSALLVQEFEEFSQARRDSTQAWLELQSMVARANDEGKRSDNEGSLDFLKIPSHIAVHANDALVKDKEYFKDLIQVLAIASRKSVWRKHFGCGIRSSDVIDKERARLSQPDCILEVARRACTLTYGVSPLAIEGALKIIANCCANNNVNRGLIIHRDGIATLLQINEDNADMDILIPTLYNVCVDFDEPAIYLKSIPQSMIEPSRTQESQSGQEIEAESEYSLAIERLASPNQVRDKIATFEYLLSLQHRLPEHIQTYLAELVEMATLPALSGWQYVRPTDEETSDPWFWSFKMDGRSHDTVELITELALQSQEGLGHMRRTVLNLLSQDAGIQGLLRRDDDSIWALLTMACREGISVDDDEALEEILEAQKASLKVLYHITGSPSFLDDSRRGHLLLQSSSDRLLRHDGEYQNKFRTSKLQAISKKHLLASACVVISQLAASEVFRNAILDKEHLIRALGLLLSVEDSPDVLYPAITIVARLSIAQRRDFGTSCATLIIQMRRLLTQGGLGLIIPTETVIAYKMMFKGQPETTNALFIPQNEGEEPIATDMLKLWTLTIDAGTKLEINNFFIDVLRVALAQPASTNAQSEGKGRGRDGMAALKTWVDRKSREIAEIFGFVCIKAELASHRDHGWFGLGMLSVSEQGQAGVLSVLESQHELREAVLRVSRSPQNGPSAKNVMLMVAKLLENIKDRRISSEVTDTLQQAANNLGISTTSDST